MIKSVRFLVVLSVMSINGFLLSMQPDESFLSFILNKDLHITSYTANNMDYAIPPTNFLEKNILDTVPLRTDDRNALQNAFKMLSLEKPVATVPYELIHNITKDKVRFLANIICLTNNGKDISNFFVKVAEIKTLL
ncbi:MAG TPA: hypothetical protein VLB80_00600 [Candidatus Babeliales bacterium]|nr:hypothetical protein [Candidatus Babeliales bacterium]